MDYLKLIHHPKDQSIEAFETAYNEFLDRGLISSSKSYIQKINKRLEIIKGRNDS